LVDSFECVKMPGPTNPKFKQGMVLTRKTNSWMFGCGNVHNSDTFSDTLKVGEGFMGDVIKLETLACSEGDK
jgi:hypothetical protein